MTNLPKNKRLILFDGICNLCNASVRFIIKHDKQDIFRFATLKGETGKAIIKQFNIDTSKVDSIILYNPLSKNIEHKSTAALKIAKHLKFPLHLLSVLLIIPMFIRNWVYDIIATNRYKWFGKKEACMVPTPELNNKFLD